MSSLPSNLTSDIRGKYFYLYLFLDVFSRKIVGFDVFDEHSDINFVTPNARHNEEDQAILTKRTQIYELAKQKNPCRWSEKTRNWARVDEVLLNTKRTTRKAA